MGCSMASSSRGNTFYKHYSLSEKISQGQFSQVHLATAKSKPLVSESHEVTVKIVSLFDANSKTHLDDSRVESAGREVGIWRELQDHDNIVRFGEAFFDNHLCYIVTERCSHTLFGYLDTMPSLTEVSLRKVFAQMLRAISHLHSAAIVHCDIRPENFQVGGADGHTLKLCDFSYAARWPKSGVLQGTCGGSLYMSPEMKVARCFTEKTDIYSFGVIAYLLLCGNFPCVNKMDIATTQSELLARPDFSQSWLSNSATCFLKMVLCRHPKQRSSAKIALNLLLMNDSDQDQNLPCLKPMIQVAAALVASQKPPLRVSSIDMMLVPSVGGRDTSFSKQSSSFSKQSSKVRPAECYVEEPMTIPKIRITPASDISTCSGSTRTTRDSALMTPPGTP